MAQDNAECLRQPKRVHACTTFSLVFLRPPVSRNWPTGPSLRRRSSLMKGLLLCLLMSLLAPTASAREWFVRQAGASDTADGSADHPLRTINAAAQLAQPGDIVTVSAGIYYEW